MREQLLDGDAIAIEEIGNVLAQWIGELELTLLLQMQDGSGRKGFGDRGDVEPGFVGVGNTPLIIRHAIRLMKNCLAVFGYQDGAAEVTVAHIGLHLLIEAGGLRGRKQGKRENRESQNQGAAS